MGTMKRFGLCLLVLISSVDAVDLVEDAYPSLESMACDARAGKPKGPSKIVDITHEMRLDLPSFDDGNPLTDAVTLLKGMRRDGHSCNLSELKIMVHSGTHVDAPGHFVNEMYEAGFDVNGLDLNVLVGKHPTPFIF